MQTTYAKGYSHALRKTHGANKPPLLMKELIEYFTKSDGRVLDPFVGVGGTLIGASICDTPREAVGIELDPQWKPVYEEVCENDDLAPQEFIVGDCLEEMTNLEPESFDFVAMDPPYNLHFEKTMCDEKYDKSVRKSTYRTGSGEDADFAQSENYDEFLHRMFLCFEQCFRVLKPGAWMNVIVRNCYQNGEYTMVNADLAKEAREVGFTLKGEKMWSPVGAPLRPYGYPYSYVPNLIHQHIIIFQKPKK